MAHSRYTPIEEDPEAATGLGSESSLDHGKANKRGAFWLQCVDKSQRIWPVWLDYKMLGGIVGVVFLVTALYFMILDGGRHRCAATSTPDFQLLMDWAHLPRSVNASSSSYGVVATDQSRCSRIGAKVLRDGGNAVDAAVATILCLGVVNPIASGMAGGMLMTIQLNNGTAVVINAREEAPAGATADMYEGPDRKGASREGGLAVGVPLELKGLWRAHRMYGQLPWSRLVAPAAKLAETGFKAHPYLVYVMSSPFSFAKIKASPSVRSVFLKPCGGDWRLPQVGEDCCSRPKLGAFLRQIAALKTEDEFYTLYNRTADVWAAEVQAANGILTADDIKNTEPRIEEPLTVDIKSLGLRFAAPKPPSSAAVLLMALKVLAEYGDMKENVPRAYVRLAEAMKHAFAVKLFLGDGGYAPLTANISNLLQEIDTPEYIEAVRKLIADDNIQPLEAYGATLPALACEEISRPEEHGTSQISIMDKDGNAVSATTTVNFVFGAKFLSESTQVVFNNQMDDFFKPGTDSYGRRRLLGADKDMPAVCGMLDGHPNGIAPGKKPLSSMSPTIVSDPKTNRIVMVTGASGGPLIIGATLHSLFRVLVLKQSPWTAISTPRIFNELFDGGVPPNCTNCDFTHYENFSMGHIHYKPEQAVLDRLEATHHNLSHHNDGYGEGVSQAVVSGSYLGWEGVGYVGVSDPRKDGAPYAYEA